MSCGKLHEAGEPFHFHAPGEEHAGAAEPAGQEDRTPGPVRRALAAGAGHVKTAAAGAWARDGYLVKPFALVPAADGAGWFIHQVFGASPLHALYAAAAAGFAGGTAGEVANRRAGAVRPVRTKARQAAGAATGVMALAGAATPAGPYDIVQWAALTVLAAAAGRVSYEKLKAHPRREPAPLAALRPAAVTAGPDPRMTRFTAEFCQPEGPLAGVTASAFRELPNGFMFELSFVRTRHSPADVRALEVPVAKLYGVRRDAVEIDYVPDPERDNENHCQVLVRKLPPVTAEERARPEVNRWDGLSTWNPETGTFDLGPFADQKTAHYQENRPRSGAMMGLVGGVPDSGKSGTLHVLAAEAGQAVLCARCGRAGSRYSPGLCAGGCDLRRVMAVLMGDAQAQSMGIWKGRADAAGWGVEGCLELLEFADAVYEARGQALDALEWWDEGPDGRRRHNTGKSWWDVEIGWPLVDLTIDEWPLLITDPDPDVRAAAKRVIIRAVTLWRKRGIHPRLAAQTLDMSLIGVREVREIMKFFNVIGHRLDESSSAMAGLGGDPRRLSRDTPGAGYTGHYDRRDRTEFTTKYAPVQNGPGETGADIRHLAGIIGQTPLEVDPGYQAVMDEWGIAHRMVFEEWKGRPAGEDGGTAVPFAGLSAVPPAASPGPAEAAGTAYREDAEKVRAYLLANPGPRKLAEIMQGTDLNLGPAKAACAALVSNGQAERAGDREYQAA